MTRLWMLGLALFALTMACLSLHVPGALGIGSIGLKTWFVVLSGASAAVYLLAVLLVTRSAGARAEIPERAAGARWGWARGIWTRGMWTRGMWTQGTSTQGMWTRGVWVVLLVAAALRLPLVVSPPFLSTDIYRYVWDGRVQAFGVNPYRYLPADPALASLRDAAVYPRINRANYAPTIYPPAAQVVFAAVGVVWSSVAGVKAAMVGFEVLAVFCLLRLLAAAGLPAERVLIYAWNPLPVWAFAGNGHIDAAAIGLLSCALLLLVRRRSGWAGVALGLAIATKFLPAVVAPVFWRRRGGWWTVLGAVVTIGVLYALYSSVGMRIFGFLSGYGSEEGYDSGSGFWLLAGVARVMALPGWMAMAYKLAAVLVVGGFGAWFAFVRRPEDPVAICAAAGTMMALATFAISPHYPWYFAWLAVPCVLAPSPPVLWLGTAPILMYLDTFGDRFVWPSVVYVPAIVLLLAGLLRPSAAPIKGIP